MITTPRVLITGGAGYIGSHVNKILTRGGVDTVVLDNLSRGHCEHCKWGTFVQGDLADTALLARLFSGNRFDAVMHFAAFAYVGESVENPLRYYGNNVRNTVNLLQAMADSGVNRLIFSSTCSIYGNPVELPLTEEHPKQPVNPYGSTKLMVEQILADMNAAGSLAYVSLRYFNAAGADPEGETGEWHEPEPHLIPIALDAAAGRRENVQVFGTDYDTPDGTCIRDYIHVNDLADAHVLALGHLMSGGRSDCFNVGNGNGFSVREVIETCRQVTGRNVAAVEAERRPGDPARLVAGAEKIQRVLGWKPRYQNLPDIIKTAWDWHRKLHAIRD